jgi:hypothetical protein
MGELVGLSVRGFTYVYLTLVKFWVVLEEISHIYTLLWWTCGFVWKRVHVYIPFRHQHFSLSERGLTYLYLTLVNLWVGLKEVSHMYILLTLVKLWVSLKEVSHISTLHGWTFVFVCKRFHIYIPHPGELVDWGFTYLYLTLLYLLVGLREVSHIYTLLWRTCGLRFNICIPYSGVIVGWSERGFTYT